MGGHINTVPAAIYTLLSWNEKTRLSMFSEKCKYTKTGVGNGGYCGGIDFRQERADKKQIETDP